MQQAFGYPCPNCRTTSTLHDPDCRFDGVRRDAIEKAYIDVLSALSVEQRTASELQQAVPDRWSARHAAALDVLRREHRVQETDGGVLRLLSTDERKEQATEPDVDPLRTIYRKGSVPGCHDHAVFAMIAWYEMVGFSWPETKDRVVEWLIDSGTWDRGGFEEQTPDAVLENKRHVFDSGYGWMQAAREAKAVIDRSL